MHGTNWKPNGSTHFMCLLTGKKIMRNFKKGGANWTKNKANIGLSFQDRSLQDFELEDKKLEINEESKDVTEDIEFAPYPAEGRRTTNIKQDVEGELPGIEIAQTEDENEYIGGEEDNKEVAKAIENHEIDAIDSNKIENDGIETNHVGESKNNKVMSSQNNEVEREDDEEDEEVSEQGNNDNTEHGSANQQGKNSQDDQLSYDDGNISGLHRCHQNTT